MRALDPTRRFARLRRAARPLVRHLAGPALALLLAVMAMPGLAAPVAPVAPVEGIAAVVNDDVISLSDLRNRLELSLLSSGLEDTERNRGRLRRQALQTLIEDRLKLQEAGKYEIEVPEEAVAAALGQIAGQNDMAPDAFKARLARAGVPERTLRRQLRASLAWRRVVQERLRPRVEISEAEIEARRAQLEASLGKPRYLISEILLPVGDRLAEREIRRLAGRLISEIRKGAPFPAVARQFSAAAGAMRGGDLGWVVAGQLPDALNDALAGMRPGEVAGPIRSLAGYHILWLRDIREPQARRESAESAAGGGAGAGAAGSAPRLTLEQLVLPLPDSAPEPVVRARMAAAREIAAGLEGCADMRKAAPGIRLPGSGPVGPVAPAQLPPPAAEAVRGLAEGEPSEPLRLGGGLVILMVCERSTVPSGDVVPASADAAPPALGLEDREADRQADEAGAGILPARAEIRRMLIREHLDRLQRRKLRDLRSSAYIDIRI